MAEDKIWLGIGIAILLFLIVTTPGWKEVLGINIDLSGYLPALFLLLIMGGILAIVMFGGQGGEGGS